MRKWLPLATVCLATFMLFIDVMIVNVAMPAIAADLQTSFGSLQWVFDGYTVALASLVLAAGTIADIVGHRRVFVTGVLAFAITSAVSGAAPTAAWLVSARIGQGVGAAAILATTFALLNSHYTGSDRGVAYGVWGSVSGGASALGPVVGGLLTENLSWRWVFLVNLPIAAVVLALTVTHLTRAPGRQLGRRLDVPGAVAFTAAMAALTRGLILANGSGWGAPSVWLLLGASVALLVVFLLVELRSDHPLFDLGLLRSGPFVGVMLGALLIMFAAFGTYPYTSVWLQSVLGMSAMSAGLTAVPLSAMAFVVAIGFGRLTARIHHSKVIGLGLLLVGLGATATAALVHGSATWQSIIPGAVAAGIGVGLANPVLASAAAASVPLERAGMAAGALNTMRQLGLTFGVAALGTVFATRASSVLATDEVQHAAGVARRLAAGQARQLLAEAPDSSRAVLDAGVHHASSSALQWTFLVCGVVALVASALVYRLLRPRPPHSGPGLVPTAAPEARMLLAHTPSGPAAIRVAAHPQGETE